MVASSQPAPGRLLEPCGDHLRVDWTRNVYRRAPALRIEIHMSGCSTGVR
jgi:hypothetical protein